jgi:hypothetical protein
MAVYKVIQDVEAEDKILGPLSLKQLIYAGIAAGFVFLGFRIATAAGSFYLAIPFLPFVIVFGALAAPLSRDQSTEMWLAAMIRFYTKPRKRIWDQDGMKELVHITVPKKIEKHLTDGLNQDQVRSRLSALANTLDSRGWAVKNVDLNLSTVPGYGMHQSDRLIDTSSLPQLANQQIVNAADDILDVNTSQVAQHFDTMMKQSGAKHRQEAIAKMHEPVGPPASPSATMPAPAADDTTDYTATNQTGQKADFWFMHETAAPKQLAPNETMFSETVVHPGASDDPTAIASTDDDLTEEEKAAIEFAKERQKVDEFSNYTHHKVILTPAQLELQAKELAAKQRQEQERLRQEAEQEKLKKAQSAKTHLKKADTIELAKADNLKVSTIAGLAKHKTKEEPDEVIINLH